MNKYFDISNDIDKNKLQISEIGKYSISTPKHAKLINIIIGKYYANKKKPITITDATANVGGNTIAFGKSFKHVNAVEIVPEHCKMLENNVDVYKLKNVKVHCGNYLNIMNKLKQNVVFIDPPWGGRDYKKHKSLKLYLYTDDNKKVILEDVINKIKDVELVVLKVPYNFDFIHFYQKIKYKQVVTYNLKQFMILVIIVK